MRGRPPAAVQGEQRNYTWMCLILPFMEQKPVYDQINFGQPGIYQVVGGSANPTALRSIVLKDLVCPSDTTPKQLPWESYFAGSFSPTNSLDPRTGWGYTSYAGNSGYHTYRYSGPGADSRLSGVFQRYDAAGLRDIHDGTAQTIMVAETTVNGYYGGQAWKNGTGRVRSTAHGVVIRSPLVAPTAWENAHSWLTSVGGPLLNAEGTNSNLWGPWTWPEYSFYPVYYYVNGSGVEWHSTASSHPSGIQTCLADGSVRFVPYSIACGNNDIWGRYGNVWAAAHTIDGLNEPAPDNQSPVVWP
jgi:hypothetical protein